MRLIMLLAALFAVGPVAAQAQGAKYGDESKIELKDGPGKDLVLQNCRTCHSADYIPMNSPILDRKGWETSVNKMIKVMGAPISETDAPKIIDYLATHYGKP